MAAPSQPAVSGGAAEDAATSSSNRSKKLRQLLKIAMPHMALYLLLLAYLLAGAWAFASIESEPERLQRVMKMEKIDVIYRQISTEMINECGIESNDKQMEFNEELYKSLSILSQFMENNPNFRIYPYKAYDLDDILSLKWDIVSSILYALSILTTTGYGQVAPMTALGQWLSIGYGLFGIPLMILAAVNIGRFLSDVVLLSYSKIEGAINRLSKLFGFTWRTSAVISQVETKAIKILQNGGQLRNSLSSRRKSRGVDYALTNNSELADSGTVVTADAESAKKLSAARGSLKRKKPWKTLKKSKKPKPTKKHLPLSVNAAILLIFCMLGGLVYMAAGGNTFIEGLFVTFNLVANLTMSEMPTDVSHLMTVVYIFVFVMFGLAVLSMCANLAASELKWVFLKIHYFGRKINWKRKSFKKEEQMQTEVTELLKVINQIRAKYPNKQQITSLDILKYVRELNGRKFDASDPYRTFNMFFLQRRDTIAFMPRSIESLKFADELEDLDETTAMWTMPDTEYEQQLTMLTNAKKRHSTGAVGVGGSDGGESVTARSSATCDDLLLCDRNEVNWRRVIRPHSDPNTFIPFLPYLFRVNSSGQL